ncbi:DUF2892 domain-containing protein [Hymenobacter sp. CRA2]|uniref:YgaP family membrane protein n=1 Tax=Hymenobacter sp. CRA2 TaxID=1955620 RepID=UPI0009D169D5|nr:DUF2892 domain-containing protein [Hymenobacter sp. CRA2]OON66477.1 hypothetical protein B0919_21850 [Hymenobacter sp. CRA2]
MHKNLGKSDRIVRGVLGLVMIVLAALPFEVSFAVDVLLYLLGGALLLTGALGYCPIYAILDISTNPEDESAQYFE